MKEACYFINGAIPSKKNSKQIKKKKTKNGLVPFISSSDRYKAWENSAVYQIIAISNRIGLKSPIKKCHVEMIIKYPDLREADNTNKAESVMDALVKAKVLKDDNWKVVDKITIEGCLDRENPGALVKIIIKE